MTSALTNIDLLADDVEPGDLAHSTMHDYLHVGLKAVKNLLVTLDDAAVKKTGDQTIAGIKTFSSPIVGASPTADAHLTTKLYVDQGLSGKTNTGHTHSIANITSLQTTLDSKAPLNNPSFTGTVSGVSKSMVGLDNVNNTSDTAKPVSTAQQTALNLKANLASPTFTGTVGGITKSMVGLSNVDNTSDLTKPISTATQSALDLKATDSGLVHLSGTETISGLKTFSTAPKLKTTSTAGYAWVATGSDGSGDWSAIVNAPDGTVPWANITGKTSTFPPEAHIHAIADITNLTTTLASKVDTTRTISAGTGLTGGGDLSANRTISVSFGSTAGTVVQGNDGRLSDTRIPSDNTVSTAKYQDASITVAKLATTARPNDMCYVQTLDTRAVGPGEIPEGVRISRGSVFTGMLVRLGTADASGTTTVEIRKNGVAVVGTSVSIVAPALSGVITGSWSFPEGDILTVHTTAIGTTPGKRLTSDIIGYLA